MCLRVGDDEVGATERLAVDGSQDARSRGPRLGEPTVGDDRVVQRDERVEDDRARARHTPCGAHVGVPRVADDEYVEVDAWPAEEPDFAAREPGDRA